MTSDSVAHSDQTPLAAEGQIGPAALRQNEQTMRDEWREIIENLLMEWAQHPESLEDDGIDPPTSAAVAGARQTACLLRDQGSSPPTNVAPTGDGGIAIHYEHGDTLLTIEVDAGGNRELRFHYGARLVRLRDPRPQ